MGPSTVGEEAPLECEGAGCATGNAAIDPAAAARAPPVHEPRRLLSAPAEETGCPVRSCISTASCCTRPCLSAVMLRRLLDTSLERRRAGACGATLCFREWRGDCSTRCCSSSVVMLLGIACHTLLPRRALILLVSCSSAASVAPVRCVCADASRGSAGDLAAAGGDSLGVCTSTTSARLEAAPADASDMRLHTAGVKQSVEESATYRHHARQHHDKTVYKHAITCCQCRGDCKTQQEYAFQTSELFRPRSRLRHREWQQDADQIRSDSAILSREKANAAY